MTRSAVVEYWPLNHGQAKLRASGEGGYAAVWNCPGGIGPIVLMARDILVGKSMHYG